MPTIKLTRHLHTLIMLALAVILGVFASNTHADNAAITKEIANEAQVAKKYADQKLYAKALDHYQKALSNSIKINGERHKDTLRYKKEIGIVYLAMEKNTEARDILGQTARAAGNEANDPDNADIYRNLGLALFRLEHPNQALDWYEKALTARESALGAESLEAAEICMDIAFVHESLGDNFSAVAYYGRALTIREKKLDESHPSVTELRNKFTAMKQFISNSLNTTTKEIAQETQLAKKYADQHRYTDALDHYKKALSASIAANGEQHSDVARYKNEIGVVYINMGKYADARNFLTQAAEIAEKNKKLGSDNPDSAAIYKNLGFALYRLSDHENALIWHQKALAVRESTLGTESLEVAETCADIAAAYEGQGNYQAALDWYNKALKIRGKALGAGHPTVAAIYDRIAAVHQLWGEPGETQDQHEKAVAAHDDTGAKKISPHHSAALNSFRQGDYENALKSYKQALAIEEKNLGTQDPVTMATRNNIAVVYEKKGDHKQAVAWYKKTLADREKVFGKGHYSTAETYSNIAVTEAQSGNNESALENLRKAIKVFENTVGEEHPHSAIAYTNMAWVYSRMKSYDKAEGWARKAMVINEKLFGKEHPTTGKSYSNVAMTYMNREQYDKAIPGYLEAYRIYLAKYGDGNSQTRSMRSSLERAYKQANIRIKDSKPFNDWLAESLVKHQVETRMEQPVKNGG